LRSNNSREENSCHDRKYWPSDQRAGDLGGNICCHAEGKWGQTLNHRGETGAHGRESRVAFSGRQ
jgi:hypothetical protein